MKRFTSVILVIIMIISTIYLTSCDAIELIFNIYALINGSGDIEITVPLKPDNSDHAHIYDNDYDDCCNICGYEREIMCLHESIGILDSKDSTCIENGLTEGKKCIDCGEIIVEQKSIPLADHKQSDWVIDEYPTVDCEGSKHIECSVCNVIISEHSIPILASDGLVFVLNEDGNSYSLTQMGTCVDIIVAIPRIYEGLPVTKIADKAFFECNSLNSVLIPNSVEIIGNSAFESCDSLTNIFIPNSVKSIGDRAFEWCPHLENVIFDENSSLLVIGNRAFNNCFRLVDFVIPNNVTSIGEWAFFNCKLLANMVIPEGVTSISYRTFSGCTSLASVVISESVTSIGDRAFEDCTSLREILIPSSVKNMGECVFWGCPDVVIYCKVEAKPDGWNALWNFYSHWADEILPVTWNYKQKQ